jgi:hypothetical protein
MSNTTRALFVLSLVAFAAACAPKPAPVEPDVAPVTVEPTYSGKYGS